MRRVRDVGNPVSLRNYGRGSSRHRRMREQQQLQARTADYDDEAAQPKAISVIAALRRPSGYFVESSTATPRSASPT